ncbi:unnamed protein product [Bursaphelenchus xylophilus]|uniref:(pine wood nematode) hypothetical protein n=1 Tax=Bursaphelenchus xylophilus TaxID=6326 RepID=A0A1I7S5D0_BURXY|nr:unnamed protein product [Bursaphelenchus xylophilus]CAG9117939.1 unnamed protein product [Bursaphelenchus xylophilus]
MLIKSVVLFFICTAFMVEAEKRQILLKGRVHCANNRNYREMTVLVVDTINKIMFKPIMPAPSGFFQILVMADPTSFSPVLFINHRCDSATPRRIITKPFIQGSPQVYYTRHDIELD